MKAAWGKTLAGLKRFGFAVLVLAAIALGALVGLSASIPHHLPGVSLESPDLFRAEIGLAAFVLFYIPILAFALALNRRGFTQIGSSGVGTGSVVGDAVHSVAVGQEEAIEGLKRNAKKDAEAMRAVVDYLGRELEELRHRVQELEKDRKQD